MRFRIRQDDITVVEVDGEPEQAENSILHYAAQYRQDGEVTVQYHTGTHWKRFALFCQWPLRKSIDDILKGE